MSGIENLSQEQREVFVPYAKSAGGEPFANTVRWFTYVLVTGLPDWKDGVINWSVMGSLC